MIEGNIHRAMSEQSAPQAEPKHPVPEVRSRATRSLSDLLQSALLAAALLGLGLGLVLPLRGHKGLGDWAFIVPVLAVLTATTLATARRLLRGELGVDLIAVLAMAGALALREYLAASILAVMLTGGTSLERYALARARRELSALIQRAPRTAHRRTSTDVIDIGADEVVIGDLLVVKPGEVVPVEGIVASGSALLDESALTGESKPAKVEMGVPIRSGGTNAGGPYPVLSALLRDEDPTGPLIQTHHGIHRLSRLYGRLVAQLPAAGPTGEDLPDLRRVLYGLHAVLQPHFAQEDDLYSLVEE